MRGYDWLLIINSGALNHRLAEASVLSMLWRSQIKHFVGLTEVCQFMIHFYKQYAFMTQYKPVGTLISVDE